MRQVIVGVALGIGLSVNVSMVGPALASDGQNNVATGTDLAPAARRLAALLPQPPSGWELESEPDSMNVPGMLQVQQQYVRSDGRDGALSVMFMKLAQRPAPAGSIGARGQPGLSVVDVGGLKANLMYDARQRGGTLSFNAGRHSVVVVGEDVTSAELVALARRIDTAALTKI